MIWSLFLAVIVGIVAGQDGREKDPLRYNPHERVYKFDGNDKRQHEILKEFNSPDYVQPTLILDYRYMKTGGREYVQGPGGQYIILPHGIKSPQHTKYRNFDELLDAIQYKQQNKEYMRTEHHKYEPQYDYHSHDKVHRHHDERRHEMLRHDERRHDERRHDELHIDERRHDDRYDD